MSAVAERIPIASDHAGYALKERLAGLLRDLGYDVEDLGTHSPASTDYPDYAHPLAEKVASGAATRGVLLCGTGNGMAVSANRHRGVRAALAWSPEIAKLAREHNDANVLVLPARFVSDEDGAAILKSWLETPFAGGRHQGRVEKIEEVAPPEGSE